MILLAVLTVSISVAADAHSLRQHWHRHNYYRDCGCDDRDNYYERRDDRDYDRDQDRHDKDD